MSNYKPQKFAEMIGVSVKTLQRWDREGILKAYRTPKNRRYYTDKQYAEYAGKREQKAGKAVIYARVSNNNHKDDLNNQIEFLKQYANAKGMIIDEILEDYVTSIEDAEPVKHGRWKAGVTCSECGFVRQTTRSGNPMFGRYCPYCGAKMDLKDGESE